MNKTGTVLIITPSVSHPVHKQILYSVKNVVLEFNSSPVLNIADCDINDWVSNFVCDSRKAFIESL